MFDLVDDSSFESFVGIETNEQGAAPPIAGSGPSSLEITPDVSEALTTLYDSDRSFPCSGRAELFFAPPGERRVRREKREATARAYCDQCVVKEMCKLAGRSGREHGIWGGETEEERAAAGFQPRFPARKAVRAAAQCNDLRPLSA